MTDRIRAVLVGAVAQLQRLFWWLLGRLLDGGSRMQSYVDSNGIVIFVGPNGSGKSLAAVDSLLPTLDGIEWTCEDLEHVHNRPVRAHVESCEDCERGPVAVNFCGEGWALLGEHGAGVRLAYSTLPLLDPATGAEHALYRPLRDYRQLVEIEHADVLFDEVAGVSDASDSSSTPAALTRWLQQLRKRDVRLRVTTPAYKRCSLPIRQVATAVVDCRSYFTEASETGRLWRPRRAMHWSAYDGFAFSEFEKTTGERVDREAQRHYWRPSGTAQRAYSTLAQVHALAEVTDAGMCMACGGTRSRPKCACGDDVEHIPYGALKIVEKVTPSGGRTRHAVNAAEVEPDDVPV